MNLLQVSDFCHRLMILVFLVVTVLIGNATGCSADGNGRDDLTEAGSEKQYIEVMYVSLRKKTGDETPDSFFNGERGTLLAGMVTVAFTPIWGLDEIADSAPFYIPDERIELTDIEEIRTGQLLDDLASFSRRGNGNVVVYIHGYNIDFAKSCKRSAIFQRSLGLTNRLLLISWPADGNVLKYTRDEADLVWSVPQIAQFIERLTSTIGKGKVDIVAHSLGSRGIAQALVRLSYRYEQTPILNDLVLIAPDIDADTFRQDLHQIRKTANRITLYASENDKALLLSQEVHGYPRLGQAGDELTVLEGVETIDISLLSSRRLSGHLYHLFNQEVIADLKVLLQDGKSAGNRQFLEPAEKDGLTYWRLQP